MTEEGDLTAVMISDRAWEDARLVAVSEPIPIAAWLRVVEAEGMRVSAEPCSLIEGGAYDGGHVLVLDNDSGRSRFAVPAEALPLLRSRMGPGEYEELIGRTPKPLVLDPP